MKKNIYLLLGFIFLCLSGAQSQNIIRPKISCPNDIWVNSYNGVLFYMRADISVPNRDLNLEAVFYYNSSSNKTNYGYGKGWSLGYEMRYSVSEQGVTIESGDGRQDLFTRYGNNFVAPAGVFSVLTADNGGYRLREKSGIIYIFGNAGGGKVTQVINQYGNRLDLTYNGDHLASISDINGRSLLFQWSDSLLSQLSSSFDNRVWHYDYDTIGNLISVTNPLGQTVNYSYTDDNRIKTLTDAAGFSTWISYDEYGRTCRVKTDLTDKSIRYEMNDNMTIIVDYLQDGNNQFSSYLWDSEGRVIEKRGNCCGNTSKLSYDAHNNVTRVEDANGNATTYTYDGNGNMLSLTDPLGYTEQYTYEPTYNKITSFRDKRGGLYQFSYDENGFLISLTDPMNHVSTFTGNNYGQPLTSTNPLGNTTTFAYDNYGNRVSETDPLGNSTTMQYSVAGLPVSVTSQNNGTSHLSYNAAQWLTTSTDAMGHTTHYTYNATGNVTSIVDPRQNNTHITYDALRQPLTVTGPMNNTTRMQYNGRQKLVSERNAMNGNVKYYYDDNNRLIKMSDELNDETFYYYDNVGNVIGVTQPNGRQMEYRYDALNRLVWEGDQLGAIQQYRYDANGNMTMVINGMGDTLRMNYNALNQLTQRIDPQGNTGSYSYDNNGNLLTHTDATGGVTSYVYDAADRLVEEHDALNNITRYTYDGVGNITSVQDANGNTTSYQYDANDRLTVITFANGKTRRYWYDGNGNITRCKDEAGNNIDMSYDALDRLVSRSYPDNSQDVFTYDLRGNMLTAVNSNASLSFTYDATGKLLTETQDNHTSRYVYDVQNNTIGITYPGGRAIQEQYDVRGRLTAIKEGGNPVVLMEYNANNQMSQRTYNNGSIASYRYDAAGRLTGIADGSIMNLSMSYDNGGNMLSKIDSISGNRSEQYQYDALHRLVDYKKGLSVAGQIPNPLRHIQYALDALGNRTTVNDNGATTQYAHNSINAYTAISGAMNSTPQYDNNGNMTADGNHSYQYNYNNRMIAVDNGNTATYQYDALNRRVYKKVGNTVTRYYYRGQQMIEERNSSDTVAATYLYGFAIDQVLQMRRGSNNYYYHTNHLGSVCDITDAVGDLVEHYDYDPYGKVTMQNATGNAITASSIGNNILFTGRELDPETGLYYYRARTMNPNIGRFMQKDPLMYVDGMNNLEYVRGNPIIFVDPSGEIIPLLIAGLTMANMAISGWDSWNKTCDIQGTIVGSLLGAIPFPIIGDVLKSITDQVFAGKSIDWGIVGKEVFIGLATLELSKFGGDKIVESSSYGKKLIKEAIDIEDERTLAKIANNIKFYDNPRIRIRENMAIDWWGEQIGNWAAESYNTAVNITSNYLSTTFNATKNYINYIKSK